MVALAGPDHMVSQGLPSPQAKYSQLLLQAMGEALEGLKPGSDMERTVDSEVHSDVRSRWAE